MQNTVVKYCMCDNFLTTLINYETETFLKLTGSALSFLGDNTDGFLSLLANYPLSWEIQGETERAAEGLAHRCSDCSIRTYRVCVCVYTWTNTDNKDTVYCWQNASCFYSSVAACAYTDFDNLNQCNEPKWNCMYPEDDCFQAEDKIFTTRYNVLTLLINSSLKRIMFLFVILTIKLIIFKWMSNITSHCFWMPKPEI